MAVVIKGLHFSIGVEGIQPIEQSKNDKIEFVLTERVPLSVADPR